MPLINLVIVIMAQTSSPVSKSSPRPQPLKAVLPITSVTKDASGVNWKSENSSPCLLSPTISWKNRAYLESGLRSPGALNRGRLPMFAVSLRFV